MKLPTKLSLLITFVAQLGYAQLASFTADKEQDCNILKVTLDASASKGVAPLTYYWDFGNGNTVSGPDKVQVEAIYIEPGTPVVTMYVIDATGKRSVPVTKELRILSGPKIDFGASSLVSCTGKKVDFINKTQAGSSPITGYIWNIGNNLSFYQKDASYTFGTTGEYDVTLIATDANGCNLSLKKEKFISIKNGFNATFSGDSIFSCEAPLTVRFKDKTSYSSVPDHSFSYFWDFGDGSSSNEQHPQKTYEKLGTFPVQLTVTDKTDGCVSQRKLGNYITLGGRKPNNEIKFDSRQCTEYTYSISPNTQNLPSHFKKSVDLGDGTVRLLKTEGSFNHTYKKSGTYIITTVYTDPNNANCFQKGFDTLVVPTLGEDLLVDNRTGCKIPMEVNFSTKNIADGLFYEWDFGDGTSSQEAAPNKIYSKKGTYTVRLKVWSKTGCVYTIEKKDFIKVGELDASFTSDAKRIQEFPKEFEKHPLKDSSSLWGGCLPFTVNFKNNSTNGSGLTYSWDFGDGSTTLSSTGVAHTYTREGIFSPSLTISDSNGCSDTYTCTDCVRAGNPPQASITESGPDTVCCLYDKTFSANVNLKDVDLLWYNIVANDGLPPYGLTQAYYKDAAGQWNLEDNTTTIFPFPTPGLGLRYGQTNFALPSGNDPDFYFYAYKNGCPTKIEHLKYQHHVLPWGTFAPLPCELEQNLKGGDTLDFNKIGGNWILGLDRKGDPMQLTKAVVKFEFKGKNGCAMPVYTETYTPASLGLTMSAGIFQEIQKAGKFPKIVLPNCAARGDELLTTTYLYTADDATKYYKNDKCLCEEHWPYKIGSPPTANFSLTSKKGCAPMKVDFKSNNTSAVVKWIFEDGTVLQGSQVSHTFLKPGKYRFRMVSNQCSPTIWQDSIQVSAAPTAHFKANQSIFCLNNNTSNMESKTIQLTDSSFSSSKILTWEWDAGKGQTISKTDNSPTSFIFEEKDVPADPSKGKFIYLSITDSNGCKATDSINVILRRSTPVFSMTRSIGCYDSLKLKPNLPQLGPFYPYEGSFTVFFTSQGQNVPLQKLSLTDAIGKAILLNKNGSYTIRMELTEDALGKCASHVDSIIEVNYQSLMPDFKLIGKTRFSCVPAMIGLEDATQLTNGNSIKKWNWIVENTTTKVQLKGTGPKPSQFALTDTGYYNVHFTIEDQTGCKKSVRKDSLLFIDEINGKIISTPQPLCPAEEGVFKGFSPIGTQSFWDFGDGTVAEGNEVRHAYSSSGTRNVSFVVTDTSHCKKSFPEKVLVKTSPKFDLGKDTSICHGSTFKIQGPDSSGFAYKWNNNSSGSSLVIDTAGVFMLTVKDTSLHCSYSDSIKVSLLGRLKLKLHPIDPVCVGEKVTLTASSDKKDIAWQKNKLPLGNGETITFTTTEPSPLIQASIRNGHCIGTDSLILPVLEHPKISLPNLKMCPGDSVLLSPTVSLTHPAFRFRWSYSSALGSNDSLKTLQAKQPGVYTLSYGKTNCLATASSTVSLHPLPSTETNLKTRVLCEEDGSIELDGGSAKTYQWLPSNESRRYLKISKTGQYIVKVGNEFGCYSHDTVLVENRCPPKVYVPTAFTPEQTGENQLHTIFGYNIGSFRLLVYNRWGEVIYESNDIKRPWDGYYRGELMPSGVYPWIITYNGNHPDYAAIQQMEGKVVLVR